MIGRHLAHFELVSPLGKGGMGEVWLARDLRLQRDVAIKLLPAELADDPASLAALRQEAQVIASLNHPNIVTIYSIEEADGHLFLQMELVRGSPLSDLIPPEGFAMERFFDLALPLVDAVQAAHEAGVVHRDLKPTNIMVTPEDRLKVLDFGIATLKQRPCPPEIGEDLRTEPISSGARICGTIPYMSPEQIQGGEADPRSDIFSLGIVLYEMAAGERPFRGKTVADVMAAILKDDPEPVTARKPALPRQLERILRHCLEKDLRQRLQVSLDLRNELESLRNEIGADHPIQGASIAVLPFEDMSPDRDQGYFCSGIAEEILIALSGIRDLRVVSRTSSFQFGGSGLGSREIGRRLGVATLLEGSVRKAGSRVRVTAELIDVTTGYTLWSRRYDRELKDVFEIQDEIARRISSRMRITLSPEERSALGRAPTTKVQAYDYYLRGREFYFQYRRRGIQFGLEMFRRAIAIDPHYAQAHAGVADCCAWLYMYGGSSEENRVEADRASRRALELDPELAEAHVSRGVALSLQGDYGAAERCFEEAIRLDPDLFEAHYFYARDCFAQGKAEKAIEMFARAAEVRPDDCQSDALVAQIFDELGRHEEARTARRTAVERATARLQLNPDDTRTLYLAANALVALGETERGLEWAGRALSSDPDEPMVVYNIACIHALAGHHEKALDLLEHAVNAGLTQRDWLLHDGDLRPLREHPRFQDIIAALDHLQAVRSDE